MQLDIYNKTTIETETIVYDIVREWQTVYTHKSITHCVFQIKHGCIDIYTSMSVTLLKASHQWPAWK